MASDDYVVVFDPELDFCRLRRADSEDIAGQEILWSGNGLRAGYDAMIRLNLDRRGTILIHVVARAGHGWKLTKGAPEDHRWKTVETYADKDMARTRIAELRKTHKRPTKGDIAYMTEKGRIVARITTPSSQEPEIPELS
jgi:hypothetical protein